MKKLALLLLAMLLAFNGTMAFAEAYFSKDDEPVELTYWVELSANAAVSINSYSENLVFQTIAEKSNYTINFIHPASGEAKTAFNLMLASRELPDIIEYSWNSYEGGAQKAIDDGVIIALNDLLPKHAPDAYAMMTKTDSIYRQCTTDAGTFSAFMPVANSTSITNGVTTDLVQGGPIVRADWLEALGMDEPETIEDWTEMLTAFRDEMGATAPLTTTSNNGNFYHVFMSPYGISYNYFIGEDGSVKFAPLEDGYVDFLKQMNEWYEEGLLDPDFASNDNATQTANMLNGVSGAFAGAANGGVGNTNKSGKAINPDFDVKAVAYPVLNEGDETHNGPYSFQVRTSGQAAITTACENPEAAARFLNYFYTDEGGWLKNFGVEGYSYNMDEDGNVFLTELLSNNPDGLSSKQALARYSRGDNPSPGPVIKTTDYTFRELECWDIWVQAADNILKTVYPAHATQNSEEATELSMLTTNIDSYVNEMLVKYIMGTADIDETREEYLNYLSTLNIERVLELKQAAVERYNAR